MMMYLQLWFVGYSVTLKVCSRKIFTIKYLSFIIFFKKSLNLLICLS